MIWIVDTSALARRDVPAVAARFSELLEQDELVLAPATLLEMLRAPQGSDVAAFRDELEASFRVLEAGPDVFTRATQALVELAATGRDAHRLPVADLHTAALAHTAGAGVLHLDRHFSLIADRTSLVFAHQEVCSPEELTPSGDRLHPASQQRELRRELNRLLHDMPTARAEALLRDAVRRAGGDASA